MNPNIEEHIKTTIQFIDQETYNALEIYYKRGDGFVQAAQHQGVAL